MEEINMVVEEKYSKIVSTYEEGLFRELEVQIDRELEFYGHRNEGVRFPISKDWPELTPKIYELTIEAYTEAGWDVELTEEEGFNVLHFRHPGKDAEQVLDTLLGDC